MGIAREVSTGLKAKALEALAAGETQSAVAKQLKFSKQYIHWIAKQSGLTKTKQEHAQERAIATEKLNAAITEVVDAHPDWSIKEIAKSLGAQPARVRKALSLSSGTNGHGGRRLGAGRKPMSTEKKVRLNASITPSEYLALANAGNGSPYRGLEIAIKCLLGI